jgi:toxin ParE1/3/4
MTWTVDYAESARQDLRGIFDYIAYTLLEPVVAENQVNRIMDTADSLESMPKRHRLYDREPWRSHGLRIVAVDNYVILYLPDEVKQTVTIIRIMYGRRDIDRQLNAHGE